MHVSHRNMRWMAGPLAAAMLLAAIAPAAQADHWRGRRYKGVQPVYGPAPRYYSPSSVYVVRHSSAGPAIAGFLGGLFLGATLAHSAPAGYVYWDPYCGESFASLEIYRTHLYHHHHARIIRVIESGSGECVHAYNYYDGGWHDWDGDGDWDD